MLALLLAGCAPDLTPTWAFDPIWAEPLPGDATYGFQTWELFGPRWDRKRSERHYVCAVVVELAGAPVPCDAEPDCELAWEVTPELVESDCSQEIADDPLFVSLQRLAIGGPALGEGAPWPGSSLTGWADYGAGWEIHGHAYPEALDRAQPAGTWSDGEPHLFVPTKAFPWPP